MSTQVIAAAPVRTRTGPRLRGSLLGLLLVFGGLKLALQIAITLISEHAGYGLHRDELYYLICGHRLALGYVDQPPLVALQARAAEWLFGYRHLALFRLLPNLAGALTVMLTGLLADALGGTRRAAALAMLAVLTAPVFLATQSFLSMNAWEPVFWMGMALAVAKLLPRPERTGWWLLLGASAGLGLENKVSAIFFIAALLLGLAATPARRLLRTRGFLLAAGVCLLLVAPNLWWQAAHGFPTWEWLQAVRHSSKDVVLAPPAFLFEQVLMLSPLQAPVWLPGLFWLLCTRSGRPWRALGWLYLFFLAIMMALNAKDYYVAPVYPLLFATGAVFWTEWAAGSRARTRTMWAYAAVMTCMVVDTAPFAVPVVRPATFERFERTVHFAPIESEQHPGANFPEFFADHLGWQGLADAVGRVYRSLPRSEQRQTGIITANYGQASAIDILGRGLPRAISGHQNFWLWGSLQYSGKEMIVVSAEPLSVMLRDYRSCTVAAHQTSRYQMPWEQRFIYVCRDRFEPFSANWEAEKLYR